MYEPETHGLSESAIGYRYSDDDGRIWSEVRIFAQKRSTSGDVSHANDGNDSGRGCLDRRSRSIRPYNDASILVRSEDQGRTWELLPGQRHGGWYAKGFNRMDEGR